MFEFILEKKKRFVEIKALKKSYSISTVRQLKKKSRLSSIIIKSTT